MKQFLTQFLAFPGTVGAWLTAGADAIHETPYRLARLLPMLPGMLFAAVKAVNHWFIHTETVQEVLAIYGWLEKKAYAIHCVPYRLVRWLPTVPGRWRAMWQRIFAWMGKKDITPRLKIFVPLCLVGLILPFCIAEVENREITYVLTDGVHPAFIQGYPSSQAEYGGLSINTDSGGRDAQMVLNAGQTVTVTKGNMSLSAVTRKETVANFLRRMEIECGEKEMVVVDINGASPKISVLTDLVYERQVTLTTTAPGERRPNYLMEKGKEKVVREAVNGTIVETYRDIYREGALELTQMVQREEVKPVAELVEYGTRVNEVSRSDRIKKVVYNDDGSGYLLFKSGKSMTFSEKVTCNATAYSIGNWTASGLPTKVGHIAVDPKVFPYHTRFYIYTDDGYLVYGNAVAADCGTAIKGHKIDLWFETFDEACAFGRRNCTVFVLD